MWIFRYIKCNCRICPLAKDKKKLFKVCVFFFFNSRWHLPLNPIKLPVFYYKAKGHILHTFIYETDEWDVWGLPELEYPGLVKVNTFKIQFWEISLISSYYLLIFFQDLFAYWTNHRSRFQRHCWCYSRKKEIANFHQGLISQCWILAFNWRIMHLHCKFLLPNHFYYIFKIVIYCLGDSWPCSYSWSTSKIQEHSCGMWIFRYL